MDREKVIKGMECLTQMTSCVGCPYWDSGRTREECLSHIGKDAIALLKEQKAVVRCKDCKRKNTTACIIYCIGASPRDDWFCADGERQEGR